MKKNNSRHPLTALSLKLGAKQSELLELLEISRPLLHGISTGKRPISGRTLRKIELFALADASLGKQKTSKKPIAPKECNHKASVIDKKIYDVTDKLAVLQRMDDEGAVFGRMLREPAAREAFGAFMEKRKPDFSKL